MDGPAAVEDSFEALVGGLIDATSNAGVCAAASGAFDTVAPGWAAAFKRSVAAMAATHNHNTTFICSQGASRPVMTRYKPPH